jgi:Cd2+/Zn2+-exporting ATPase
LGAKSIPVRSLKAGSIKVKVMKPYADSTVAKLLDLVQNSASKKSKADRFIKRFQ